MKSVYGQQTGQGQEMSLCFPRGGHSLVSSVPMRDQKNDEKGYFFSRRAVRSADII